MNENKSSSDQPVEQPNPQDNTPNLPDSNSSTPVPPTNPTLASMPPNTQPKQSKGAFIVVMLIILVVVVVLTYLLTKSTTTKAPAVSTTKTTTPVAVAPAQVNITKSGFVPATLTIQANQGVVWTNKDTANHQVDSDPYPTNNNLASFNESSPLLPGQTWDYIFTSPGTYTYHDNLNPFTIKGTIVVK